MYHLAIDMGATSGTALLGQVKDGKIILEEVHRFKNRLVESQGYLCWDYEDLFSNIIESLKECGRRGKKPVSMAIDTWAVDFVLLDAEGRKLGPSVSYRDHRTQKSFKDFHKNYGKYDLYKSTGIQLQEFNTIYQLKSIVDSTDYMERADSFLMTPDYFNYLLTGKKYNEYTNLTTTALLNAKTRKLDQDLLEEIGVDGKIFEKVVYPGDRVGSLKKELVEEVGFDLDVLAVASHDTASAILSVPCQDELNNIYISSGTWSLLGTVVEEAIISEDSYKYNFTNEGYIDGKYRYLKNLMGLWILESVLRELEDRPSYEEILDQAIKNKSATIIDVNDQRFLAPKSMLEEIEGYVEETGQKRAKNIWETFYIIYNSLAFHYGRAVDSLEETTGKSFDKIIIVGGGSKASLLNDLTREHTKKEVIVGYTEATAIGNLLMQEMSYGKIKDYGQMKQISINNLKE